MAPSIVSSSVTSAIGSGTSWSFSLPNGTGDGYALILASNNGAIPQLVTATSLFWNPAAAITGLLSGGETGVISVWHAPFLCFQNTPIGGGQANGETAVVTWSKQPDAMVAIALILTGMGHFVAPVEICLDLGVKNGPIYFNADSQTAPATVQFSTNDFNDLSLAINISDQGSLSNNVPTGYSSVNSGGIFGANNLKISLGQQTFTASQTNNTWSWGGLSGFGTLGVEYAYSDGTGGGITPDVLTHYAQPNRRSKLISPVIGR